MAKLWVTATAILLKLQSLKQLRKPLVFGSAWVRLSEFWRQSLKVLVTSKESQMAMAIRRELRRGLQLEWVLVRT